MRTLQNNLEIICEVLVHRRLKTLIGKQVVQRIPGTFLEQRKHFVWLHLEETKRASSTSKLKEIASLLYLQAVVENLVEFVEVCEIDFDEVLVSAPSVNESLQIRI
jgi:hypothetical protein